MYEEFFGFSAPPFRLNPDPKFFFGSRSHNKAMAYLHYGLRQGEGFIVITGEIGAGKSMLISHLLDQLDRSNVVAAHLLTANLEPSALLSHILSAFRIEPAGAGESAAHEAFEDFLFDQMNRGRRVLLIVDEAQNLPMKTIEELRMLSNMDYDGTPLFQVFLIGQPEFRSILSRPNMEQFRQRVIASYHLEPLSEAETMEYIKHRLSLVGWMTDPTISEEAFSAIYQATGGVPRKINKLCNRILMYCNIEQLHAIDADVVETVLADLRQEGFGAPAVAETPAVETEEKLVREQLERETSATDKKTVVIPFEATRKNAVPKSASKESRESTGAQVQAPCAEESASMDPVSGHTSVLDRLRARKQLGSNRQDNSASVPADETVVTLKEVAKAIAEASAASRGDMQDLSEFDEQDANASLSAPEIAADPKGWRKSIASSINETRDDLKTAHQNMSRLRRRLAEIDKRRLERRRQIAANLVRAETLLLEIQNSWR